jgi:hypothetical protein
MCERIFSIKELSENDEEWFSPSEIVITKRKLFSTNRELLERIHELETENQTLQKQVQELEKALIELVKIEVRLPECAVCWERNQCTDRSHGSNCLAIGYIVDTAKEAAKE